MIVELLLTDQSKVKMTVDSSVKSSVKMKRVVNSHRKACFSSHYQVGADDNHFNAHYEALVLSFDHTRVAFKGVRLW